MSWETINWVVKFRFHNGWFRRIIGVKYIFRSSEEKWVQDRGFLFSIIKLILLILCHRLSIRRSYVLWMTSFACKIVCRDFKLVPIITVFLLYFINVMVVFIMKIFLRCSVQVPLAHLFTVLATIWFSQTLCGHLFPTSTPTASNAFTHRLLPL